MGGKIFSFENSLFSVAPFTGWGETEFYDPDLEDEITPVVFEKFDFDLV